MKFIRKGGKIIPLREKKDGNVDKRHVSDKKLSEAASRKKISGKKVAIRAGMGVAAGSLFGKKGALIGGVVGAIAGTIKTTSKQDVANKLKRKAKK